MALHVASEDRDVGAGAGAAGGHPGHRGRRRAGRAPHGRPGAGGADPARGSAGVRRPLAGAADVRRGCPPRAGSWTSGAATPPRAWRPASSWRAPAPRPRCGRCSPAIDVPTLVVAGADDHRYAASPSARLRPSGPTPPSRWCQAQATAPTSSSRAVRRHRPAVAPRRRLTPVLECRRVTQGVSMAELSRPTAIHRTFVRGRGRAGARRRRRLLGVRRRRRRGLHGRQRLRRRSRDASRRAVRPRPTGRRCGPSSRSTVGQRHFAAYVLASHPAPVAEAIAAAPRRPRRRHTTGTSAETEPTPRRRSVTLRPSTSAPTPTEVALTDSTTMGLGLLYGGLRVPAGHEVLTTEHDFYSTHQALGAARRPRRRRGPPGPALRRPRRRHGRRHGRPVDGPGHPRHPGRGGDVGALGHRCPAAGAGDRRRPRRGQRRPRRPTTAPCCASTASTASASSDGACATSAATSSWRARTSGCSGRGAPGIVWGRAEAWAAVDPAIPAFEPNSFGEWRNGLPPAPTDGLRFTPGGYHSFEHRWALAEAFRSTSTSAATGWPPAPPSRRPRSSRAWPRSPGVRLVTPTAEDLSAGIVCFDIEGTEPVEVVGRLAGAGFDTSRHPLRRGARAGGPEHRHHPRRGRRPPRGAAGLSVSPRSRGRRPGGPRTRAGAGRSRPTRG